MSRGLSTRAEPAVARRGLRRPAVKPHHRTAWRLLASPLVIAVGDAAVLLAAFLLAYTVRYVWEFGPELTDFQFAPLAAYWVVAGLFIPVTLLSFAALGRYVRRRTTLLLDDLGRIGVAVLIGIAAVIVVFFVSRPLFFSRLMFLYMGVFAAVGVLAWLLVRHLGIGLLRRAGYDNVRILLVGSGVLAKYLMQQLATSPSSGNRVVGYLATDAGSSDTSFGRFERLGDLGDLELLISSDAVDEVYVALPSSAQHSLEPVIERCRQHGVRFRVVPDLLEAQFGRMEFHPIAGIPLITLSDSQIAGFKYLQKRTVDISVSLLALVLTSPIWAVVALAIKLTSRGPVLFRQTRIGRRGVEFTFLKFRSMVHDAEERKEELFGVDLHPLLFKDPADFRRTWVGRWLRRFSLDELPQLVNVLAGSMSLVGPRAQVPAEVAQYDEWARHRLRVLPGLTGLWQVSGRSDLPFEEMVMLDTFYVSNWSLGLDLKILLKTIPAVISGRGAY